MKFHRKKFKGPFSSTEGRGGKVKEGRGNILIKYMVGSKEGEERVFN